MKYRAFRFTPYDELLLAKLASLEFDSFIEEEDSLVGYISVELIDHHIFSILHEYSEKNQIQWDEVKVENKNWNEIWESSFEPVAVEDFCLIKASFHDIRPIQKYSIIIDPKMAFGTGHHQTTYMMIKSMSEINFLGRKVFDYGSGTGVLAILAEKLGADRIVALDIEESAYENIIENAGINHCYRIHALQGTIVEVEEKFDIILANINRNVLLNTAVDVKDRLASGGILVMSGILEKDVDLIRATYDQMGFTIKKQWEKGSWTAIKFVLD